jgi:putative transposase
LIKPTQPTALLALGTDAEKRAAAYRALLDEALDETTLAEIRNYLQQQRALGHDGFRMMVEAKTERFAGTRPAHRPRKQKGQAT